MPNKRQIIILVDDNPVNLSLGRNMLKTFYSVYPVQSAAKMFEIMEKVTPDLILLDIEMPDENGYDALVKLKAGEKSKEVPVIFLTSKNDAESELEGFNLGAVDYITKPFSAPLLLKRIENQLLIIKQKKDLLDNQKMLQDYAENLEEMVREKTAQVVTLQNAVIATVADLVEFRDGLTGGHISRTGFYLKTLVNKMIETGCYSDEVTSWNMDFFIPSAQLHDVGKIAITDLILNKPGKLTPEEFEIMKTHVTVGVDAIEKIMNNANEHEFLQHALYIVGTHHEKWNGTGYPIGLKGRDIPLEGRLMAIADVYDALITVRPYKKAFSHEEACKIIEDGAGSHFDGDLVEVFRSVQGDFERIASEITD